ncbi:MAG: flagellar basal body P-ring formation chaperone FlgA [Nitrospirota bacterium]
MNKRNKHIHQLILTVSISMVLSFITSCLSYAETWTPEDELKAYLADNYPWDEIEVSNVQAPDIIPAEQPEGILVEKGPLGRAVFSFIFTGAETISVKADVRALGPVVVSRRPFQKRHVIGEEDIYVSKMDIGKMPRNLIRDPKEILGKSLKRSIKANMPIEEDMIEMNQPVKRGKRVVLLLSHKGMVIRTEGKTKEKGYVGMSVKAINISSKKVVSGVLIDENTVQVEL